MAPQAASGIGAITGDVAEIAAVLEHVPPSQRAAIVAWLQIHRGNAFVQAVLGHAAPARITAEGYAVANAEALRATIQARLAGAKLPEPHERLVWIASAADIAAAIAQAIETRALPELLYPIDPWEVIDLHRDRGASEWNPIVGQALGLELELALRRALPRIGTRYVAQADDYAGDLAPDMVIASHPIDRIAARLICDRTLIRYTRKAAAKPWRGIRLVRFEWLGDRKLWNWVRALDPVDATAEEVAASVFEYGDGKNHTEYAYALTAAPPFFRIAPQWARRYRPAAPSNDGAIDLADSALADDAAAAQAVAAKTVDIPNLQQALANAKAELCLAGMLLERWKLSHLVGPPLRWIERHEDNVLAAPMPTLRTWTAIAAAQAEILGEATDDLLEVLDAAAASSVVPGTAEAKPFATVIGSLALAIGESHLARSGAAQLAAAKQAKAMLPLALLERSVRDSHDAVEELATTSHLPVREGGGDPLTIARDSNRTLEAGVLALRARGALDPAELDTLAVAASEQAVRARLLTLYGKLGELAGAAEEAKDGALGQLGNLANDNIRSLHRTLVTLQPEVWTILETLQRDAIPRGPAPTADAFALARKDAVAHAQAQLATLREQHQLDTLFQRAVEGISHAQRNTAYFTLAVEIAALIGVGVVGSAVGSLVGGVVRGAILADAAADTVAFARTAKLARWAGAAANLTTDAAIQAGGQTLIAGGDTKQTFLENVMTNLMTLGVLRPFAGLGRDLAKFDNEARGLWRVASAGKVVLAQSAKLTIETLVGAGTSYVAACIEEGHPPPSDDAAVSLAMQGVAMVVGHFIHGKARDLIGRWSQFGEERVHFLKRARMQERLAGLVEDHGVSQSALRLLEEHARLLQDEQALLRDEQALAKLGLDPSQIHTLRAGNEAALADTRTRTFEAVRLRFRGLEPLTPNGVVWSGTREQIKEALAEARNVTSDRDGIWSADVAGQRITFLAVERPTGLAGPDLHTHIMGVRDTQYFVDKIGSGSAVATLEKISKVLAAHPGKAPHAENVMKGVHDTSEAAARSALDEMFAAGPTTPFDVTYPLRELVVEKLIDPGGGPYRNYARDTMTALADEGIGYSEQSVGLGKLARAFPEDMMRELHGELARQGKQIDVRFLAMVSTTALSGDVKPAKVAETLALLEQALLRGDVIGTDFAGPEKGEFTPAGMDRFEQVYDLLAKVAAARDRPLVLRPHVGEGYNVGGDRSHVEIARKNLEMMITKLEAIGYSPARAARDKVIVRFGHATHATPEQLQRIAKLGVIVEANIGSNEITRSIDKPIEHPLLTNLYYGVETVLGTDGGGVMRTDREREYKRARKLIDAFRRGAPLLIGDHAIYYEGLTDEQKRRFSIAALQNAEDAYHAQVIANDRDDGAKR